MLKASFFQSMGCQFFRLRVFPIRLLPLILLSSVLLQNCANFSPKKPVDDEPSVSDSRLTFKDVTLQQFDEQGRLLWRVKAKQARYSQDKKTAKIQDPSGELFQDGKLVFRILAKQGEVKQDGNTIVLQNAITATMVQDGAVLKGQELEWRPKEDLLIVRKNLIGTHPQFQATGQEARAYSRARKIELIGPVTATSKDPALALKGENFVWEVSKQLIRTDKPILVNRIVQKKPTDRAIGKTAKVDLKAKTVTLEKDVQLVLVQPPLNIAGQMMVWNMAKETVVAEKPLTVTHREEQVTISANQGSFDLKKNQASLVGQVLAIGKNQSQLRADFLTWAIPNQEVLAEGNVTYRQNNPPLNLAGPRAIGRLGSQTIVISGGTVVTEIVP